MAIHRRLCRLSHHGGSVYVTLMTIEIFSRYFGGGRLGRWRTYRRRSLAVVNRSLIPCGKEQVAPASTSSGEVDCLHCDMASWSVHVAKSLLEASESEPPAERTARLTTIPASRQLTEECSHVHLMRLLAAAGEEPQHNSAAAMF